MVSTRCTLLLIVLFSSSLALAQEEESPTATESLEPEATAEAHAPEGAEEAAAGAHDTGHHYEPLLSFDLDGMTLRIPLSAAERIEGVSAFPMDSSGTEFAPDPAFNTELRAGLYFSSNYEWAPVRVTLEYEHAYVGQHSGGLEADDHIGHYMPLSGEAEAELRKASLALDFGQYVHISGGFMASYFGMGLLANDGSHLWEPGSAEFTDPRGGDLVLRGLLALGPFTDGNLLFAVGADQAQHDDTLYHGDEAEQLVASLYYGYGQPNYVAAYAVIRQQTTEHEDTLDVNVVDLTGAYQLELNDSMSLEFSGEIAYIWGETTLSPNVDFPIHQVEQLGAAARVALDAGDAGAVLDFLLASGDNNFDDETLTGFKADSNYPMGLLLHRYVIGAHTGRGSVTAFDPDLSGYASEDLDRIPSRGALTNTVAFFPRGWWRPIDGLEIYGGPLFAFSEVDLADPFNSRLAGGDPRNALDGDPGGLLATELDLGIRYRTLLEGTELTVGVEGGILLPGSGLADADGENMESITGGRAMVEYRF